MKPSFLIATGMTLITLLGSCNTMRNNKSAKITADTSYAVATDSPQKNEDKASVLGFVGDWSITELDGSSVKVNGENHPKLSFEIDDVVPNTLSVIGFNGCNYLNGTWSINNGKISPAGEFITSLKSCADAPYEQSMNSALHNIAGYSFLSPQELNLLTSTGRVIMTLRKQSLDFINGAWKVTNIESRDIDANIKIVIDTNEGRIHGNAGCNILNGNIIVNYDKGYGIEFQNLATSRMTCPDIAEEQAFLIAIEQVATATPGKNPDTAYLCNQAGQKIITLKRLTQSELADD